jgi:hypothetical protein
MNNLLELSRDSRKITSFSRDFVSAIEKKLKEKGHNFLDIDINCSSLDKNTGYVISWTYKGHWAELIIAEKNDFIYLDQFQGIKTCNSIRKQSCSPNDLRNTAQIYDEITELLKEKYGSPVSEHDGRSIYKAKLEEKVNI